MNYLLPRVIVNFLPFQFILGLWVSRNGIPNMVGMGADMMSNRTSHMNIPKSRVMVEYPTTSNFLPSASYTYYFGVLFVEYGVYKASQV